ncbi:MAG: single-stranded DNA-binding protein [Bifidobacteriaceae bacterium]|jgi:single-strand DNA-binding protein|nr:single-stranded DNA-binding protein [Bifidobacteriaceae bacterium]
MNKKIQVSMTGYVATEPKYKVSASGTPYIKFRLAHSFAHFDTEKNAWIEDPTLWFTIKAWNNLATNLNESVKKSDVVYVTGSLRRETWEGRNGAQMEDLALEANFVGHDLTRGVSHYERNSHGTIFDAEEKDENVDEPALKVITPKKPAKVQRETEAIAV